jgi:SHS2 domain-containing protein
MSKELNHVADIMFELHGKGLKEIIEDLFDAFNKIFIPIVGGLEKEYVYNINKKNIDDIIFDIGNYSLNKIYEGYFPSKVEMNEDNIKISFSKIIELKGEEDIKAIAYPKIIDENEEIKIRVIFDI